MSNRLSDSKFKLVGIIGLPALFGYILISICVLTFILTPLGIAQGIPSYILPNSLSRAIALGILGIIIVFLLEILFLVLFNEGLLSDQIQNNIILCSSAFGGFKIMMGGIAIYLSLSALIDILSLFPGPQTNPFRALFSFAEPLVQLLLASLIVLILKTLTCPSDDGGGAKNSINESGDAPLEEVQSQNDVNTVTDESQNNKIK